MRISKYLVALAAIIGAFTCAANEYVDGVADRLGAYIRVDTTNPPGNETRGVEFIGADRKSTRLNSSHPSKSRMPSSA